MRAFIPDPGGVGGRPFLPPFPVWLSYGKEKEDLYPPPPPVLHSCQQKARKTFPSSPEEESFSILLTPLSSIWYKFTAKAPKALIMKAIFWWSKLILCWIISHWANYVVLCRKWGQSGHENSCALFGDFHPLSKVTETLVHRSCRICFLRRKGQKRKGQKVE
jgi:hypothetical protein